MKKIYKKEKFIPTFWGFEDYKCQDFYCYYEKGIYDKYGLHYTKVHTDNTTETVYLKGKKYGKIPFSFDTYEEMMEKTEQLARSHKTVMSLGNVRREAIFLVLDLDENGNLLSDPFDLSGFVSKRGTIFNITGNGLYDGKKRFKLTPTDKTLVFPNMVKAADYVEKNYDHWAASHYLKNHVIYYS